MFWNFVKHRLPGLWIYAMQVGVQRRFARGDVSGALKLFEEIVDFRPDDHQLLNDFGCVLRSVGEAKRGVEVLRKAVALRPDDHRLLNDLGDALLAAGELEQSVETLRRAITLHEGPFELNNLGRALLEQKKFDEAFAQFARARELDSQDPKPWFNYVVGLREKGDDDASLRELAAFVETFPGHANGRMEQGNRRHEAGDLAGAAQAFEQAVKIDPGHLPARLSLIRALCDLGRHPDSVVHLQALATNGFQVVVGGDVHQITIDLNGERFYDGVASRTPAGNVKTMPKFHPPTG